MKIKFLSFIASFFMVSFVITSCLDDDNNIEYSRMQLYMRLHLTQQALGVINSLLTNYHVKSITKTLFLFMPIPSLTRF